MSERRIACVVCLLLPTALCLSSAAYAQAPFELLHEFNRTVEGRPSSSPLLEATDGNFYGTTQGGGSYNHGTIFRMTPAGNFATIYNFAAGYDGGDLSSALIQASDGTLYGTTGAYGAYNEGMMYRLTLDGTFTILHAFNRALDASQPLGAMVQAADGNLYGVSFRGGTFDRGTIFRSTLEGDVTIRHSFGGTPNAELPFGGLILGMTAASTGPPGPAGPRCSESRPTRQQGRWLWAESPWESQRRSRARVRTAASSDRPRVAGLPAPAMCFACRPVAP